MLALDRLKALKLPAQPLVESRSTSSEVHTEQENPDHYERLQEDSHLVECCVACWAVFIGFANEADHEDKEEKGDHILDVDEREDTFVAGADCLNLAAAQIESRVGCRRSCVNEVDR